MTEWATARRRQWRLAGAWLMVYGSTMGILSLLATATVSFTWIWAAAMSLVVGLVGMRMVVKGDLPVLRQH